MDKNAEFIRKKEFHIVFKGYKPEEVDKFLDIVSVEFDRLIRKSKELQESLDKLKFENTGEETDIKKIIQDALVSAHKVAEEIKGQAKKEAEEIIEKRKAEEEKSLSDAQIKKLQLEESMIVLQTRYEEFKAKFKRMMEDINQFMEKVETTDSQAQQAAKTKESYSPGIDNLPKEPPVADSSKLSPEDSAENKTPKVSYFGDFSFEHKNKGEPPFMEEGIKRDVTPAKGTENRTAETEGRKEATEPEAESPDTENRQDPGLKRQRKKIDIANPDIIENFFRTDEDKNY